MTIPQNAAKGQLPKSAHVGKAPGIDVNYSLELAYKQTEQLQAQVNELTEKVNWLLEEARQKGCA